MSFWKWPCLLYLAFFCCREPVFAAELVFYEIDPPIKIGHRNIDVIGMPLYLDSDKRLYLPGLTLRVKLGQELPDGAWFDLTTMVSQKPWILLSSGSDPYKLGKWFDDSDYGGISVMFDRSLLRGSLGWGHEPQTVHAFEIYLADGTPRGIRRSHCPEEILLHLLPQSDKRASVDEEVYEEVYEEIYEE